MFLTMELVNYSSLMVLWPVLIKLTFWIKILCILLWMFGDAMIQFIFPYDNAPVYTARNMQTRLDEHDSQVIQWPAQSPDLNVIENVWGMLQNNIIRDRPSTNLELIQCLFRAWGYNTPDYLNKLFSSMSIRVRPVIQSCGYHIKYCILSFRLKYLFYEMFSNYLPVVLLNFSNNVLLLECRNQNIDIL